MTGTSFTCAKCGGTFLTAWPDADAEAEFRATYALAVQAAPRSVVCHDCWLEFEAWRRALSPAEVEAIEDGIRQELADSPSAIIAPSASAPLEAPKSPETRG